MENAFIVNSYMRNGEIRGYSNGILNYLEKNSISIPKEQMLLFGRALSDLSIGNKLLTPNGNQLTIYGFHLYGHTIDFISEACTCVIFCSAVNEEFGVDIVLKHLSGS